MEAIDDAGGAAVGVGGGQEKVSRVDPSGGRYLVREVGIDADNVGGDQYEPIAAVVEHQGGDLEIVQRAGGRAGAGGIPGKGGANWNWKERVGGTCPPWRGH